MIDITEKEFVEIARFIKENYGINLQKEKKELVKSRLGITIMNKGFSSFEEYFDFLINESSGNAIMEFIDKITTNYTFFMREKDHFSFLIENVLPWIKNTERNKDLRIWSAGCATGEEPYTLSMIISDFFAIEKANWNTSLLATDISNKALNIAKEGIFTKESLKQLPEVWIKRYFKDFEENNVKINDSIRDDIVFRKFNLMQETFPFRKKFHVIFCRNVMIYFDNETRDNIVRKFYDCLEPGGYLFIGHSETISRANIPFKAIKPSIYRKG